MVGFQDAEVPSALSVCLKAVRDVASVTALAAVA
jgi:hypothetical protein